MASLLAPGSRTRTLVANLLIAIPALFLAWLILWEAIHPRLQPAQPTAAQVANQQQQISDRQRTQLLCQRQALCRKFGEARRACATAGNYKNCIDIKMGDDAMDVYPCMNNGTVWGAPKDMPDRLTCFVSSVFQ